jgi:hypothetical protein
MFESTRPTGTPELMRVSEFRRYLDELARASAPMGDGSLPPRLGALSQSLRADLRRGRGAVGNEPLEVLAACVRHDSRATVHLQCGGFALPLTVFPQERLVHCRADLLQFLYTHVAGTGLLLVEPAALRPPEPDEATDPSLHHPLGAVLWQLALRGLRTTLLPEIAGPAVYRVAPGLDLRPLTLANPDAAAVFRLRREWASARAIAEWAGFDKARATHLLNALYLQAGLIVSRAHPSAIRDSWFSVIGSR